MPGDYNDDEIRSMNTVQFQEAKARNWRKPVNNDEPEMGQKPMTEVNLGTSAPTTGQATYGASWGAATGEYDYRVPSGELCRMRDLQVEVLLQEGILDKVSRLEGLADQLIQKAEGAPPAVNRMPTGEEFADLLKVINTVTRLAVVRPVVVADEKPELNAGEVKVSWIALEDRTAIMEKSLAKLRAMDRFRNAG